MKEDILFSEGLLLTSLACANTSAATGNPWFDQFKNYGNVVIKHTGDSW